MKQKLLFFFLTVFLSLIGGGKLWADQVTFNTTSGNLTTPQDEISLYWAGDGSALQNDNLKIPKGSTLTIRTSSRFIQSIEMTLREKNSDNNEDVYATQYVTANVGSTAYDDTNKKYTWTGIAKSIVFTNANVNGARDFRPVSIKVTYTTTDPSSVNDETVQTYPYTWDFNSSADLWASSIEQLSVYTDEWNHITDDGKDEYRPKVERTNWGYNIDLIKGLRFETSAASDLCLDWTNRLLWMNGTLTIPSLKVGQTITFDSNADVEGDANVGSTTGTVFIVTTAGDVSFTVNTHVRSIAVTKNDLTDFSFDLGQTYYGKSSPSSGKIAGAYIGRTNTFKYKLGRDQILRTTMRVDPDAETLVGKSLATNENIPEFTKSSSNTSVLGTSGTACRSAANRVTYWDIPVMGCGTTNLTYSFAGSDVYNAEDYVQMITIEKDDPVLAFVSDFIEKTKGDGNFTNILKLNGLSLPFTDDRAGAVNATYESKNTSVATVNSSTGEVTIVAPGVATIEATVNATDWNNKATKKYTLVVNPASGETPTISWNGIDAGSTQNVAYNQSLSYSATASAGTVKYRIADTSIAELDNKVPYKVTGKGIGSTTVTAYVEPDASTKYAETSYTVNVTSAGNFEFNFSPSSVKVNQGYTITPKLSFPTIPADGVTSLKVTMIEILDNSGNVTSTLTSNEAIAACSILSVENALDLKKSWELNSIGQVHKANVVILGKSIGKARITVTFTSTYYNKATATCTVEVTDASTTNFSWADGTTPEYYVYAGDFMMMPAISGNSNGNYNYSDGAKNSKAFTENGESYSALHAYIYEIKKGSIKWNEKNIRIGEGYPDFGIVAGTGTGTADVYFARGEGSDHPDELMVHCKTPGYVTLRAYDPQDHTKCCDATIHILAPSSLTSEAASAVTSYPYTWDFTTNFDMDALAGTNSHYWKENDSGNYINGMGFFNLDWDDSNDGGDTNDRIYKYFVAGASNANDGYMPQFKGMQISLAGTTSYANKAERMRIEEYNSTTKRGRLCFVGGDHILKLPLPATMPGSYKIYVKAEGIGSDNFVYINEDEGTKQYFGDGVATIREFNSSDISGDFRLSFKNARVYWIACSTEARTLMRPNNTSYAAATYSYGQDLDLIKSNEVNGVTAYYASSFTVDKKDVSAGSTTGEETQYAVMMKLLTSLNNGTATYVTANKGILLKKTADVGDADCYMIANPRNVDSYSAPETITGDVVNYLVGTGANSADIAGKGKDGDDDYTNFLMGYAYKYYTDVTDPNSGSEYRFDRDWSFYPLIVSGKYNLAAQRCYLKIPGNLYVDRDGNLVKMPLSSRRSAGESAEAPATKAALSIVFDDDPLTGQGTTGISTVATETTIDSDAWYTLQGVRVETPTKGGIYIHKGRKIVVK